MPPNTNDAVTIPPGYDQRVVIRWGDPVLPGAPAFDFAKQTAAAQEKQFGYNNDFVGLIPQDPLGISNLLVANHEYTTEVHMFPVDQYDPENPTEEQVKIAWAAHGLSVVQSVPRPGHGGLRVVPALQPPDHAEHRVRGARPGRRFDVPQDLRRPAGQGRAARRTTARAA